MIRPLRRAHRVAVTLLALLLPAIVAVAVARRVPKPVQRPWSLGVVP